MVKDSPRRYYFSSWNYHAPAGYYYTKLHYHQNHGDTQYKYHYVICYPSKPSVAYYYDPGKKAYWGQYAYGSKPEACFCSINHAAAGPDVTKAPPAAVGAPTTLGKVPGAIGATANMIAPPPPPIR